ncbi:MAG: PBP1A family penicillin-binding protein [Pseudomonadota bacterium]|nr:PBP1A family penicillin-binding protein [Pseudomonadota bacterium]
MTGNDYSGEHVSVSSGGRRSTSAKKGRRPSRKRGKARGRSRTLLRRFVYWMVVSFVWVATVLVLTTIYFAHDLPNPEVLEGNFRAPGITVMGSRGAVLGTSGAVHANLVQLSELPPALPAAVLAAEDRRFFGHHGVDWLGVLRAAAHNLRAGRVVQGGSTITQQLAKNVFLSSERSMSRKYKELLLSFWLEHRFTKNQLLTIYLNRVYLGAGVYGVEAAANRYFGKSARALDLAECAMLAGLLKAPSRYAPTSDLKRSQARASQVLSSMVAAGYIVPEEAERARRHPAVPLGAYTGGTNVQYFVDWILGQVPSLIGQPDRDIIVNTTFQPAHQMIGERVFRDYLKELKSRSADQAALIVIGPNGAVSAMIGGHEYAESQFNRAVQARRQPGSAFKLFAYLAALEQGFSPSDSLSADQIVINGWSPRNYDGSYGGRLSLKDAFAGSVNTVAVRLGEEIGRESIIEMARRLGVTGPIRDSPSLVLGTAEVTLLDLSVAYAAVANGGSLVWPHGILKITDRKGQVLYERMLDGVAQRVLNSDVVASMDYLLRAVIQSGTGVKVDLNGAAGKTGTSQGSRDAWFIGYRGGLTLGIWLGNDNATPMEGVSGGGLPARIWGEVMSGL